MNLLQGTPWHAYVQPIGWTLVHFLWQGAIVAMLLSAALLFLRSRSANARYLAATIALAVMALCPPLTLAILTSRPEQSLPASRAALASIAPEPAGVTAPAPTLSTRFEAAQNGAQPDSSASGQMPAERAAAGLNVLLPGLVAAWLIGVLLLSTRLLGGWVRVQCLMRRAAWTIEGPLAARCEELARRMGIARSVVLRASATVQVPAVAGWLRAVILFPACTLSGLPAAQIEAILAHELAHIRRHDYLINLTQSVIETMLFYHPAVWWVSRRIRVEREHCCDDLVVQMLDDRVGYARALTALEHMRGVHTSPALAATDGDLLARVRCILGLPSERSISAPIPFAGSVSLLLCMALCAGLFLQLARAGQATGAMPPAKAAPTQTAGPQPAAHLANVPQNAADCGISPSPSGQAEKTPTIDPQETSGCQSSAIVIDPERDAPRPHHRRLTHRMRQSPAMPDEDRTKPIPPSHLAALAVSECNSSEHQADPDSSKIERDLARIGKRMDAISRQLKDKDLTCQQRNELVSQLDALGEELGLKAARIAVGQADHAMALAEKKVHHALDQVDVQSIVQQALRCALKDKEKDKETGPPDPPDPPDTDDSANG